MIAYSGLSGILKDARKPKPKKPTDCPFVVVVDNQEQAPYCFTGIEHWDSKKPMIVPIADDTHLRTGDYSIFGFEHCVTIERKSPSDWLGSIGKGHDRLEREMERMVAMQQAAGRWADGSPRWLTSVVVEEDWRDMMAPHGYSQIQQSQTKGTVAAWSQRYGVHFHFCHGRREAELWTFTLLSMFWRQWDRRQKSVIEAADAAIGL